MHVKVAVIGGGVMGVSSAVAMVTSLQEADDICFHIYAERFSPNTTSDQAAGLCYVTRLGDTDDQLLGLLITFSYHCLRLFWIIVNSQI